MMLAQGIYGEYTMARIPGLLVTTKGTLIRYCEMRRTRSDWASIDIEICRSTDAGASWRTSLLIAGKGETLNNPVMVAYGDTLIFLYCKNYRTIYKMESTDDGLTFSDATEVRLNTDFYYSVLAVGPGHGIVKGDRILVPIWFAHNEEDASAHRPSTIATIYSDDGGREWRLGERLFCDELINPSECALALSGDGEVMISIRHEGAQRCRALAFSDDGISGWHGLRFERGLPDPICMGSMTHDGKRIFHANCACTDKRTNLTVKVSDDGFLTYKAFPVSDIGGYCDIAYHNGTLFVLYEKPYEPDHIELYFEALDME